MSTKSELLQMPGTRLYYEDRGTGPLLVMIPGGSADAGIFAPLAEALASRYRVVTYDPRGNSRSVVDDPTQEQNMDVHGDDAARLLVALGGGPAYVLGSSGGAQIALDLVARHPGVVHTLVAHEPPCVDLLPDGKDQLAAMATVHDTYRAHGIGAAWQKFEQITGLGKGPPRDEQQPRTFTPEMLETLSRMGKNMDFFLGQGVKPISSYVPDVAALRAGSTRIVVGVGASSIGQLAHRAAEALAERLKVAPVTFPGGHVGYGDQAAPFARQLDEILRNQ